MLCPDPVVDQEVAALAEAPEAEALAVAAEALVAAHTALVADRTDIITDTMDITDHFSFGEVLVITAEAVVSADFWE